MARSLAEADEMIAAAAGARRRARRRPHRALQPGGRSGAAAAHRSPLHRGPSPRHVSRAQPRHRRRLRPDDSRSRRRAVAGASPTSSRIEAVGVPVLTGRVDIANARLRFANGCIANLTASRISRDRVRKIRFFQPAAYLSIDYAAQKVEVWRLVNGERRRCRRSRAARSTSPNEEPLKRELADFVDAVVSRRAPLVTGEQGRRALGLAQQITDKMSRDADQRSRRHEGHDEDTKSRRPRVFVSSWLRSACLCTQTSTTSSPTSTSGKLLARITEPVSPDLEIAAVTDRACKIAGRRSGAAVREADRLRHPGRDQRLRIARAHVPRARRQVARRSRRRRSTS